MLEQTEPGEALWKYETPSWIRSSPTSSGGTVYVGNTRGQAYAIDASTGRSRWKVTLPNGGINASPAIDADYVYAANSDGYVAAFDRANGEEAWSVSIEGGYTLGGLNSSPLLYEQTVYIGMHDGNLYAIDATSGDIQWAFQTGSQIETSPVASNGEIYIGSNSELYAVASSDGQEEWVISEPAEAVTTPTEHDGTLYFGSEDGTVYAVDTANGTIEWTNDDYYRIDSTPTIYENSLYIGLSSGPDGIACLAIESGEEQWVSGTGNVFGSPTVAGGTIFFCTELGRISAVDLDTEEYSWTFQSETRDRMRSSPTVVDGVLYVGSDDGNLYALDAGVKGSSVGSRTEDRSFGYHIQVETLAEQNRSTDTQRAQGSSNGAETGPASGSEPDNEGPSLGLLAAGGSGVALVGYLFGKKALAGDSEPEDSETEASDDETFDLTEPDN